MIRFVYSFFGIIHLHFRLTSGNLCEEFQPAWPQLNETTFKQFLEPDGMTLREKLPYMVDHVELQGYYLDFLKISRGIDEALRISSLKLCPNEKEVANFDQVNNYLKESRSEKEIETFFRKCDQNCKYNFFLVHNFLFLMSF